MTTVLIGSQAVPFADFRPANDVDVFSNEDPCPVPLLPGIGDTPGERLDPFWDDRLDQWEWQGLKHELGYFVATVDELYTIKVSHSFWEIHGTWDKHMSDVVFLKERGAKLIRPLYDILLPIWKDKHGKKKANLNQTKAQFFADAVTRIYDHDSIHDSVAYGERPLYERVLKPGAEVAVDIARFHALDYETKCKLVREEVYATALERWVIPSNYTTSPRAAYAKAMKKTVTSLFKGEWALFIVEHYADLRSPDMDYVSHHRSNSDRLILL